MASISTTNFRTHVLRKNDIFDFSLIPFTNIYRPANSPLAIFLILTVPGDCDRTANCTWLSLSGVVWRRSRRPCGISIGRRSIIIHVAGQLTFFDLQRLSNRLERLSEAKQTCPTFKLQCVWKATIASINHADHHSPVSWHLILLLRESRILGIVSILLLLL